MSDRINPRNHPGQSGVVMIVVIIVILVLAVIAITTLTSQRFNLKMSADFKNKTSLGYKAEEGVNKALSAIITESKWPVTTDSRYLSLLKYTGPVTCDKQGVARIPTGKEGNPNSINCDFFKGTSDAIPGVRVMVVRQSDHCYVPPTITSLPLNCQNNPAGNYPDGRIFLVNSVATDSTGNQALVQSVVIVPYSLDIKAVDASGGGTLSFTVVVHPNRAAYIASIQRSGEYAASDDAGAAGTEVIATDAPISWTSVGTTVPTRVASPPPIITTSILTTTPASTSSIATSTSTSTSSTTTSTIASITTSTAKTITTITSSSIKVLN